MTTLIFLHGWGASGHIWQRQVEFLEGLFGGGGQGPRAPAPSPKPPPPTPYRVCSVLTPTIPSWNTDWLWDYLRTLPLQDCILVGWSLGGMLLLEALARLNGPQPGGLVLVGVAPVFCRQPDHPWGQRPSVVRAMRRSIKDEPGKVLLDFALRCLAPGEESFRGEAAAAFGSPPHPENLAAGLDFLLRQDLRSQLAPLPETTVIIQGEKDAIVPEAQAQFLHQQIPGSKLYLVPGAGHLPFLTQGETFNEILLEYLSGSGAYGS